jgi:vacuolar-type H+-ATPase subunit H
MKQLLQGDEKNDVNTPRMGTAVANQKAFGISNQNNKRVHSATTTTNKRSRSIHMKHEHLKSDQQQQLNEEIMKEREKIIKYNK